MSSLFLNCRPYTPPPPRSLHPGKCPHVTIVEMACQVAREESERIRRDTYFIFAPKFEISMCEMAAISFNAVLVLGEMFA